MVRVRAVARMPGGQGLSKMHGSRPKSWKAGGWQQAGGSARALTAAAVCGPLPPYLAERWVQAQVLQLDVLCVHRKQPWSRSAGAGASGPAGVPSLHTYDVANQFHLLGRKGASLVGLLRPDDLIQSVQAVVSVLWPRGGLGERPGCRRGHGLRDAAVTHDRTQHHWHRLMDVTMCVAAAGARRTIAMLLEVVARSSCCGQGRHCSVFLCV